MYKSMGHSQVNTGCKFNPHFSKRIQQKWKKQRRARMTGVHKGCLYVRGEHLRCGMTGHARNDEQRTEWRMKHCFAEHGSRTAELIATVLYACQKYKQVHKSLKTSSRKKSLSGLGTAMVSVQPWTREVPKLQMDRSQEPTGKESLCALTKLLLPVMGKALSSMNTILWFCVQLWTFIATAAHTSFFHLDHQHLPGKLSFAVRSCHSPKSLLSLYQTLSLCLCRKFKRGRETVTSLFHSADH